MQASPLYSHDTHFHTRLCWPALAGVLGAHALLVVWMLMAHAPSSPAMTPPMAGFLLSDGTSSGQGGSLGEAAGPAGVAPLADKTEKRTGQRPTKTPSAENRAADTKEKTASDNTAANAGRTASAHGSGDDTAKTGNTGSAGGAGGHGEGSGSGSGEGGAFSSPGVGVPGAYNPKPKYPAASRRMGEEGTVALSVHVLATGEVADVRLKKSSGYARLDHAAMAAVKKWRYRPARQGDTPVACWYTQAVKFSLTD